MGWITVEKKKNYDRKCNIYFSLCNNWLFFFKKKNMTAQHDDYKICFNRKRLCCIYFIFFYIFFIFFFDRPPQRWKRVLYSAISDIFYRAVKYRLVAFIEWPQGRPVDSCSKTCRSLVKVNASTNQSNACSAWINIPVIFRQRFLVSRVSRSFFEIHRWWWLWQKSYVPNVTACKKWWRLVKISHSLIYITSFTPFTLSFQAKLISFLSGNERRTMTQKRPIIRLTAPWRSGWTCPWQPLQSSRLTVTGFPPTSYRFPQF